MKKIIFALLIIATLLILASCEKKEYPAIESTDEEKTVVMTLEFDGEKYEVKYELYRALFLNIKSEIDGGDSSVWTGENKNEYIEKADSLIKRQISDIYSAIHTASKIGFDVYSNNVDKKIDEYIKVSVEGGAIGSTSFVGFGGDYDKYLESLKEMNLNYSVQKLLIRYTLALDAVDEYYAGSGEAQGEIKYTKEDLREFYDSDECVRVLRAFLPGEYFTKERAEEIRDTIASKGTEDEVGNYMIQVSLEAADLKDGMLIAKHNLDRNYYSELTDAAFSLEKHETSKVIETITGYENGFTILYRTTKPEYYFENNLDSIAEIFVQNKIGKILDENADKLSESITESDFLKGLSRSDISME